jgi:hypothetical protein
VDFYVNSLFSIPFLLSLCCMTFVQHGMQLGWFTDLRIAYNSHTAYWNMKLPILLFRNVIIYLNSSSSSFLQWEHSLVMHYFFTKSVPETSVLVQSLWYSLSTNIFFCMAKKCIYIANLSSWNMPRVTCIYNEAIGGDLHGWHTHDSWHNPRLRWASALLN